MLPNWTGWKTVKTTLATLTTFAASMALGFPNTVIAHDMTIAGIVLGSLTTAVVVASGTSIGPTLVKTDTSVSGTGNVQS
jgi:hypothetical protein